MRIAQITPGVIAIPPNGWGAVEKIIWEYTKVLRNLGHQVEIIYTDDVRKDEWDVVHVHMANLALLLRDRGIPYVFSHHDHHAYWLGKDSDVYKKNLEAIKGSVLSFVHAKYLVEYFESAPQLRYLSHGANLEDYNFVDRTQSFINETPSLFMMANNGLLGDPLYDRKGFIPGIESAINLDLPITIVCPRKNNEAFFNANPEVASYEKLKIMYDLNYEDSLLEMNKHHVFLNPGMLEAGHPNLTISESIAMGIPVAGTMEEDLPGLRRITFGNNKVNASDLIEAVSEILTNYPEYVLHCREQRKLLSWEVVVSRMLMDYSSFSKISQRDLILSDYTSIPKRIEKVETNGYYHWFKGDPHFYKCSRPNGGGNAVLFRDARTGLIVSALNAAKNKRSWITVPDDPKNYIEWEILVKEGTEVIETIKMDLEGQHVLLKKGETNRDDMGDLIKEFVSVTGCILSVTDEVERLQSPHFKFSGSDESLFYRTLNTDQIISYFAPVLAATENVLIYLRSTSLGDSISFLPYADEYARRRGIICSVATSFDFLFEGNYHNLKHVPFTANLSSYTDVIYCDYIYDMPLQLGFAKQLGISDAGKLRPVINKSKEQRPTNKKYVCFSMHSTAQAKHWNNNGGWEKLCDMLTKKGYTPVCIDRHYSFGVEGCWNEIPKNCFNKTGMELAGMINWIEHCEFFIGLSSGLSWVAHALGKKVVMISGVTTADNEFDEDCIRIHRTDLCNSCFNFPSKHLFDAGDWYWCPMHKGTSRAFECTKRISAKQVMDSIEREGWIK